MRVCGMLVPMHQLHKLNDSVASLKLIESSLLDRLSHAQRHGDALQHTLATKQALLEQATQRWHDVTNAWRERDVVEEKEHVIPDVMISDHDTEALHAEMADLKAQLRVLKQQHVTAQGVEYELISKTADATKELK